jgi:CheY-like chemotaxis protein
MNYNHVEILFAEDSVDDAVLTLRGLRKMGITSQIHHVKDGAEALEFIYCQGRYASRDGNSRLKLVLLDLKMPKVTGMEVLGQIKSHPETKSIPVVMLTSSKEDPDIKRSYELGANSYVVKPVESIEFFRAIEELGGYWMLRNQIL